ncbi:MULTISPECIES: precorrin-2 C(20)-methyltransferase [Prochlorococcus]|uniref:precorrin-2 C(20)-methyltransferase n=1 Tax=Prochlorococcus TaxID=1218 RepID=UPI000533B023|nr:MULTISPECIES: precorrin-2 C(20)-methyltransferase [Prochlorococcus]KGG13011.1 Cobalt-precorrin-2 C20-methyltransferase [Prochlorococcus sp. MIT 0601]
MKNLNIFSYLINRFLRVKKIYLSIIGLRRFFIKSPGLTLVGVGPGDPMLLTIAAVNSIKKATLIAYPISSYQTKSMAAEIASSWIKNKKKLELIFPMVKNLDLLSEAWISASHKLAKAVLNGEKVVFLCQGDSSLYATSSYLLIYIKSLYPECPITVIPGINSFSLAAAIGQLPLSLQTETLLISPVPESKFSLENILDECINSERTLVLLKLGSKWEWVRSVLEEKGLLEKTLVAQKLGFSDQQLSKGIDTLSEQISYFSLLIIRPTDFSKYYKK